MQKYIIHYSVLLFFVVTVLSLYSGQKTEITFFITLDDRDNPTQIGNNLNLDKYDELACGILNIPWTQSPKELIWRVKEAQHMYKDQETKYKGLISIDLFKDGIENPYYDKSLKAAFSFPRALPDDFVRNLMKIRTIRKETDKAIVHFFLENDDVSLFKIGVIDKNIPSTPIISRKEKFVDQPGASLREEKSIDKSIEHISVLKGVLYYALPIGLISAIFGFLVMRSQ